MTNCCVDDVLWHACPCLNEAASSRWSDTHSGWCTWRTDVCRLQCTHVPVSVHKSTGLFGGHRSSEINSDFSSKFNYNIIRRRKTSEESVAQRATSIALDVWRSEYARGSSDQRQVYVPMYGGGKGKASCYSWHAMQPCCWQHQSTWSQCRRASEKRRRQELGHYVYAVYPMIRREWIMTEWCAIWWLDYIHPVLKC